MKNNVNIILLSAAVVIFFILIIFNCTQPLENEKKDKEPSDWSSQYILTAFDSEDFDYFGSSVSISGDYIAVGAKGVDGTERDTGAVYIFHKTGPFSWDSGTKITLPEGIIFYEFGNSASISGDYFISGNDNERGGGEGRGAAYIFKRTGINSWTSRYRLHASDAEDHDYFGKSVSISGDYALAGAFMEDGSGIDQGAAYIFHRTGVNTWDAGSKITAIIPEDDMKFGNSVSIYGDYAIVGASNEKNGGSNRGSAYIFHRTGANTWDGGVKLTAPVPADFDHYGFSVSIFEDYAIIGSYHEQYNGISSCGAAYIYHRTGTNNWSEPAKLTAYDAKNLDYFGWSVSICGENTIVGASHKTGIGTYSGACYIFHRTGTNTWDNGIKIIPTDAALTDYFGNSVAISGDLAVAAAYSKNVSGYDNGAVYFIMK